MGSVVCQKVRFCFAHVENSMFICCVKLMAPQFNGIQTLWISDAFVDHFSPLAYATILGISRHFQSAQCQKFSFVAFHADHPVIAVNFTHEKQITDL